MHKFALFLTVLFNFFNDFFSIQLFSSTFCNFQLYFCLLFSGEFRRKFWRDTIGSFEQSVESKRGYNSFSIRNFATKRFVASVENFFFSSVFGWFFADFEAEAEVSVLKSPLIKALKYEFSWSLKTLPNSSWSQKSSSKVPNHLPVQKIK